MLIPGGLALAGVLAKGFSRAATPDYPFHLEPIYVGLGASLVTWLVGLALSRKDSRK